jgi:uncharacterized membrane protein YkvA (DUF1232 family)
MISATILRETGFAAAYFLKKFDLIPDHLPEIGLADDALILRRVIERNQSELTAVWPNVSNPDGMQQPLEGFCAVLTAPD